MFEAPSGKTNHSGSEPQPATGLSTTFVVGTTDSEGLSTLFPRPSRTTGPARGHRSVRVPGLGAFPEPTWEDVERRRDEWVPWTIPHLVIDAVMSLDVNVADGLACIPESADNKTPKGTSLP
jgi:hypothetical protein